MPIDYLKIRNVFVVSVAVGIVGMILLATPTFVGVENVPAGLCVVSVLVSICVGLVSFYLNWLLIHLALDLHFKVSTLVEKKLRRWHG